MSQRTARSYGLIVVEKGQFEWKFGGCLGRKTWQAQPGPQVFPHRHHGTPRRFVTMPFKSSPRPIAGFEGRLEARSGSTSNHQTQRRGGPGGPATQTDVPTEHRLPVQRISRLFNLNDSSG
jgi:hypothetical protein